MDLRPSQDPHHEIQPDGTYVCHIARAPGPGLFLNEKIDRALCVYCLGTVAER